MSEFMPRQHGLEPPPEQLATVESNAKQGVGCASLSSNQTFVSKFEQSGQGLVLALNAEFSSAVIDIHFVLSPLGIPLRSGQHALFICLWLFLLMVSLFSSLTYWACNSDYRTNDNQGRSNPHYLIPKNSY